MRLTAQPRGDNGDDGKHRKQQALDEHGRRKKHIMLAGRRAMLEAALAGDGTATADNVHAGTPLPPDVHPSCLGGVPGPLASLKIISKTGRRVLSRRKAAHARDIPVWGVIDFVAAHRELARYRQQLADHPPLMPLPTPADAAESCETAPVVDAVESVATHQRSLFGGEG